MNVFTVDLEDWFHIIDGGSTTEFANWSALPSRVERNAYVLLDLLERFDVRGTFFVLGWIAERYPRLVADIAGAGHEIASHGHAHRLVFGLDPSAFEQDLQRAEVAIGSACGVRPVGYRAPSFSIDGATRWALEILRARGYRYDSSIFPARRAHGGMIGAPSVPHELEEGLLEIPVSTAGVSRHRVAYLGGGYLRAIPLAAIDRIARSQTAARRPLVLYIHPHDVDPEQPRLALSRVRAWKRYVGLSCCLEKLSALLGSFDWGPCRTLLTAAG